jgi:hypothetical protein
VRHNATAPREGGGRTRAFTLVLLVLPALAAVAAPLYARADPRLAGVPFFYWYQFGCLVLTALCLTVALRGHRREPS